MSGTDEFFEVTSDYSGKEGDHNSLTVKQGDIVRLIKKEVIHYTVEKDGQIGRVFKGKLKLCSSAPTQNQINITPSQIINQQNVSPTPTLNNTQQSISPKPSINQNQTNVTSESTLDTTQQDITSASNMNQNKPNIKFTPIRCDI
ncbi:MAG: hypothetical protein EZS28_038746 [Streblomastix strix]|uniref:SH3 domain-containing protein n=1 Tax=Streblomastix strix TaxID=222440 RepID=A0A5J4U4N1_9EUKA|nr:MAG: hypothetical protein EZS28_038746 [Streblomastix strix]